MKGNLSAGILFLFGIFRILEGFNRDGVKRSLNHIKRDFQLNNAYFICESCNTSADTILIQGFSKVSHKQNRVG
jgi:hypothetical protein